MKKTEQGLLEEISKSLSEITIDEICFEHSGEYGVKVSFLSRGKVMASEIFEFTPMTVISYANLNIPFDSVFHVEI
jgi:hypothetical protein